MIDDKPHSGWKGCLFETMEQIPCDPNPPTASEKLITEYRQLLQDKLNFDSLMTDTTLEMFGDYSYSYSNGKVRRHIVALIGSGYCASVRLKRGIHIDQLCGPVGITRIQVFGIMEELLSRWKNKNWYDKLVSLLATHDDKLTRLVYSLHFIEQRDVWGVLSTARRLHERMSQLPHLNTLKSYTLNACCVFIALQVQNIPCKRNEFCRQLGISLPTLKSGESLIQSGLCNSRT
jgi:hypothetical protein